MAMTERSRSVLYQGLTGLIDDEEAIGEMLSYFPARDVEEPVTKDFLRAELAAFPTRIEVQAEFVAVRADIAELERRLTGQITALDDKLTGQITALDDKLTGQITALDSRLSGDIAALGEKVHAEVQSALRWAIATMTALTTLIITAFAVALAVAT